MKNKVLLVGIILTGLLAIGILGSPYLISLVAAQPPPPGYPTQGNFQFGSIASIQNNNESKPAWLLSGHWKSNLLNMSEKDQSNSSVFSTSFEMVMLDGKSSHTHALTNFVPTNQSTENSTNQVFTGTSSVSLKEGMVQDIPTIIKFMGNKVVSIWVDPSKVDNHFGDTPIYGLIASDDHGPKRMGSNSSTSWR
ncbi:MAG TPA: hypothetical protein VH415_01970 [Nitrososphaeraceae archaeon]